MEEISINILDDEWFTPYHLICLLRKYINNQDSVTYNSLFEPVIIDVRQSLGNELNRE
jgi:hypothetical protein